MSDGQRAKTLNLHSHTPCDCVYNLLVVSAGTSQHAGPAPNSHTNEHAGASKRAAVCIPGSRMRANPPMTLPMPPAAEKLFRDASRLSCSSTCLCMFACMSTSSSQRRLCESDLNIPCQCVELCARLSPTHNAALTPLRAALYSRTVQTGCAQDSKPDLPLLAAVVPSGSLHPCTMSLL